MKMEGMMIEKMEAWVERGRREWNRGGWLGG